MVKSDGTKKNFAFQLLYQFVLLVLPLITAPYLTRTLSKDGLGTYSYVYSIAYYFVVFANLGIMRHGQRIIATKRDDEIGLRVTFWSLYCAHLLTSLIGLFGYVFFFLKWGGDDKDNYLVQTLYVASAIFDVTWFFYGVERFKGVLFKNLFFKIIETILIFTLVKDVDDLWIYTIIVSSSILLGQIWVFLQAVCNIKPIRFSARDFLQHWKPLLVLSLSVIAISLYTMFDKTLLGVITNKENVALYNYSEKIIHIPKTIIGVIGTVLFPKACRCFAANDFQGMKKYFKLSLMFTYFVGFGAVFGLMSVSKLFVSIYYGKGYEECANYIIALSPIILVVGLGDIIRTQYLIPMKKDIAFISILGINAVLNLAISTPLICVLGVYGAIIGTCTAELFGLIAVMFICREYIEFKHVFSLIIPFFVSGLLMFIVIKLISLALNKTVLDLIIQIVVGLFVFTMLLIFYALLIDKDKKSYRQMISNIFKK